MQQNIANFRVTDEELRSAQAVRVNQSVDYEALINEECPGWRPDNYRVHDTLRLGAALSDNAGPNEVVNPITGRTYALPQCMYVRAIDPAGNLTPLVVSTCRPTPEYPQGDDGIGTMARVLSEKQRRGWIILDRVPEANTHGMDRATFLAWALEVAKVRKAKQAASMEEEANQHKAREDARREHEMRYQGNAIGEAIRGALMPAIQAAAQPQKTK